MLFGEESRMQQRQRLDDEAEPRIRSEREKQAVQRLHLPRQASDRVDEGLLRHDQEDVARRSEEHTSELQSQSNLVCRLLLEKKKKNNNNLIIKKKKLDNMTTYNRQTLY